MLLEERLRVCPEVNYLWPESLNVFAVGHKFLLILLPTCVYISLLFISQNVVCVWGAYIYPTKTEQTYYGHPSSKRTGYIVMNQI